MEYAATNVLCFNNGGYVTINDGCINSLFFNKSFTLECWALPDKNLVLDKNEMILFGQYSHDGTRNMIFGLFNLNIHSLPTFVGMRFGDKNGLNKAVMTSDIVGYHHYGFVYNHLTKQRKIYMDGRLICKDIANDDLYSSGQLMIGHSIINKKKNEYRHWGGIIRDIRIWQTVRNDQEIAKYFNVSFRLKLSLKCICDDYTKILKQFTGFFGKYLQLFPIQIIQLIAAYDGGGLVACFPMIHYNIYDIVHGVKGKLRHIPSNTIKTNPMCWVKDPDFLPLAYGQYLAKSLNILK